MHRSKQIVDLLNLMGLQLAVFGNHEFDFDKEHFTSDDLLARFSESNFTWLASNLNPSGAIGQKFLSQHPHSTDMVSIEISPQHSIVLFGFLYKSSYPDVGDFEDPIERCSRLIELTKNKYAENKGSFRPARVTFAALTHQTVDEDIELARRCPELRLIMGGHDHEVLRKIRHQDAQSLIVKAKSNARTLRLNFVTWLPRVNIQRFAKNFGSFENAFWEQIGPAIIIPALNVVLTGHVDVPDRVNRNDPDVSAYLAMITDPVGFDSPGVVAHMYEDDGCAVVASIVIDTMHPGFRKLVDADDETRDRIRHWLDLSPEHREVLVHAPVDLDADDEASRSRSTNFGNLVADVLAGRLRKRNPQRALADIGVVNGGSFRLNRNIVRGEAITKAVVCDLLFHPNDVRLYTVPGSIILNVVKRSFEQFRGEGNFLQVSGIEIKVEAGRIDTILHVDESGNRCPIDPKRPYVVATTSYVATKDEAYGQLFAGCKLKGVVEPSVRDGLEREMQAQAPTLAVDGSLRWFFS